MRPEIITKIEKYRNSQKDRWNKSRRNIDENGRSKKKWMEVIRKDTGTCCINEKNRRKMQDNRPHLDEIKAKLKKD